MEDILQDMKDNYCMNRECSVCYEKFIKFTYDEYQNFIKELKIQYSEEDCVNFEEKFPDWLCFNSRFICLKCKNNDMCYGCLIDLTNENISIYPACEKIHVVICPFCRSETKILPQNLLDDINNDNR